MKNENIDKNGREKERTRSLRVVDTGDAREKYGSLSLSIGGDKLVQYIFSFTGIE